MKIVCTTKEYAEMVRQCECCSCVHCVLQNICRDEPFEDAVGVEITEKEDT